MNYRKIYSNLIYRGKNRVLEAYTEKHHVIPKCMGGSDEENNLVNLTPEEHYLAHQLLVKMYPDNHAIAKAAVMMTAQRPSNKIYGWLRRRHSKAMSISQKGEGNSQFGTRWIHNIELEQNKKISVDDLLPRGWVEGRIVNIVEHKQKLVKIEEQRLLKRQAKTKEAYYWYTQFTNSDASSLREFVRNSDYKKSHVSFIKMLKTYVSEFNPKHGKAFIKS